MVGDQPVRLLGHAPVEAAQARLDVGERQVQLRRGERRCQRRVGVAVGQHEVRPALEHRGLERLQHARRLAAVAARADAEIEVGLRDAELGEEDVGHRRVVVLAGVHDEVLDARAAGVRGGDRAADRRELHELRARADHLHQAHRLRARLASALGDMPPLAPVLAPAGLAAGLAGRAVVAAEVEADAAPAHPAAHAAPGCRRRPRSPARPA